MNTNFLTQIASPRFDTVPTGICFWPFEMQHDVHANFMLLPSMVMPYDYLASIRHLKASLLEKYAAGNRHLIQDSDFGFCLRLK